MLETNKKAQGLPMSTIVLIIMVILVLVVVVIFFYTSMAKGGAQTQSQHLLAECQNYCLRAQAMAINRKFVSGANCRTTECANSGYCSGTDCTKYMSCVVTYTDNIKQRLVCSSPTTCGTCVNE